MKKVVLVCDSLDWAFANIARQIQRHFGDRYQIELIASPALTGPLEADVFVFFWWKTAHRFRHLLRTDRIAVGLYDHWSWRSHTDVHDFAETVDAADVMFCGNDHLEKMLEDMEAKQVVLAEDGVDTELFTPQPLPEVFTVGWAGNRVYEKIGQGDLKGVRLIEKACAKAGVPLVIQDKQVRQIPHTQMPDEFYAKISCYCCASFAEGTPNPVLESLACGRPVVSTAVGIVPQVMDNSSMGRIVDRNVDAIAQGILSVKNAGRQPPERIARSIAAWDWSKKVRAFDAVLEG